MEITTCAEVKLPGQNIVALWPSKIVAQGKTNLKFRLPSNEA
jgi:hypothetical protein